MRDRLRIGPGWRCALAICVGMSAGACNGQSTPTQPSVASFAPAPSPAPAPVPPPPPGDPISVLAIKAVTIDGGDPGNIAPAIRLVETSGRADALVTSIAFNLADGTPWPQPMLCAYGRGTRVLAGDEAFILPEFDHYGSGDYMWSFSVPADYTGRLAVTISYTDEDGRVGTVSAAVALPWVR